MSGGEGRKKARLCCYSCFLVVVTLLFEIWALTLALNLRLAWVGALAEMCLSRQAVVSHAAQQKQKQKQKQQHRPQEQKQGSKQNEAFKFTFARMALT